jgi:hypothetical protein
MKTKMESIWMWMRMIETEMSSGVDASVRLG